MLVQYSFKGMREKGTAYIEFLIITHLDIPHLFQSKCNLNWMLPLYPQVPMYRNVGSVELYTSRGWDGEIIRSAPWTAQSSGVKRCLFFPSCTQVLGLKRLFRMNTFYWFPTYAHLLGSQYACYLGVCPIEHNRIQLLSKHVLCIYEQLVCVY